MDNTVTSMEFDRLGERSLLRRTVDFNILTGSHLQSHVTVGNSSESSDAIACIVIGCEEDEW